MAFPITSSGARFTAARKSCGGGDWDALPGLDARDANAAGSQKNKIPKFSLNKAKRLTLGKARPGRMYLASFQRVRCHRSTGFWQEAVAASHRLPDCGPPNRAATRVVAVRRRRREDIAYIERPTLSRKTARDTQKNIHASAGMSNVINKICRKAVKNTRKNIHAP